MIFQYLFEMQLEPPGSRLLTLGTLGHPNVGKSSLINSLLGRKQVSVSRTPGHTKHFQTIFLTKTVRLSDCPGLVFPSKVPKPLQVLMGSFPIAQVREPYSVVLFLAERLELPQLLNLSLPPEETFWSAYTISQAWAERRGFFTSRTSRPDTFRAANELLRMALEGVICLYFTPANFEKSNYSNHPDTEFVKDVLGDETDVIIENDETTSSDNSECSDDNSDDNHHPEVTKLPADYHDKKAADFVRKYKVKPDEEENFSGRATKPNVFRFSALAQDCD